MIVLLIVATMIILNEQRIANKKGRLSVLFYYTESTQCYEAYVDY